ncbi:MAG: SBBP repeat-containing protein [Pirellulales bacterium]
MFKTLSRYRRFFQSTPRRKPHSPRLCFQRLEERTVLTVAFEWVNTFGIANSFYQGDYAADVVIDSTGNLLQAGTTEGNFLLRKVQSSDGGVVWSSPLSSQTGRVNEVLMGAQGQIYVAGQTPVDYGDLFVAELNPANGQVVWSRSFGSGGSLTDIAASLSLDSQGNLYVGGYFRNTVDFGNGYILTANVGSDGNGFLWKMNPSGSTQWAYRVGGGSGVQKIVIDANDAIYAGGAYGTLQNYFGGATNATTLSSLGSGDAYLTKYSTAGDLVWAKHWGGSGNDGVASMDMDASGNLMVATSFSAPISLDPNNLSSFPVTNPNASNVAVSKLDAHGNLLWGSQQNVFGGGDINFTSWQGLTVDAANNVYLLVISRTSFNDFDTQIKKLDNVTGQAVWTEVLGGVPSDTRGNGIAVDSQGNIYVTGGFTATSDFDPTSGVQLRTSAGNFDSYLVKLATQPILRGTSGNDVFSVVYSASGIEVTQAPEGGTPVSIGTFDLGTRITVDGMAGNDRVVLAVTPDQLGAFTTADILVLQNYLAAPTGRTLYLLVPSDIDLASMNFESAALSINDDNSVTDITACFQGIASETQILVGTTSADVIYGSSATDLIFGQGGDDTLYGLDGSDCLYGGAGHDAIFGGSMSDLLVGGSGNDSLIDDLGFDRLIGGSGADRLEGGLHDDQLDGGPGQDTILGGAGYDVIKVRLDEAATDIMNGGDNTDTIMNDMAAPVVLAGFDASVSSIESWSGNNQPILGTDAANVLSFLVGPSYSMSLAGVSYVDGRGGNDTITGTYGVDNLRGGEGNDILNGLGGVDTLYGDAGDDSLNGGDGVDYLYGGDGVDTITTGAGRDVVYFAGDLSTLDTITDFALYSDTINLQAYATSYSQLSFNVAAPITTITLTNGKKIRLLNWSRVVSSSQFMF